MIKKKLNLVHDGPHIISVFVYDIDTDKPKCYIEGSEYKFNLQLVTKLMFANVDRFLKKLEE